MINANGMLVLDEDSVVFIMGVKVSQASPRRPLHSASLRDPPLGNLQASHCLLYAFRSPGNDAQVNAKFFIMSLDWCVKRRFL